MRIVKEVKPVVHPLFKKEYVILDGAMGTMLQANGLKLGQLPELLNFTEESLLRNIYRQYLEAGSDLIYANTFGANRHKLDGCGKTVTEVITQGITVAREEAHPMGKYVALDIGPIGTLLEPSGSLTFEDAYDIFKEMMVAGEQAGADVVVLETMTDLYEVKAGLLACRENTSLPILVTMTFEENRRTFTGCSIEAMAVTLQSLGADAIGLNCSLGPKELKPLVEELLTYTHLPVIVKPNAGLPHPETGEYHISVEEFSSLMMDLREKGVSFLGGCCGTTPSFIKALTQNLPSVSVERCAYVPMTKFCSATDVVSVDTVRVIGERINPTGKKRFAQALQEGDIGYVLGQALEQVEAGAELLDVNVGVPEMDEASMMVRVVKALQSVVTTPLQIDSSKLEGLEAGLRVYNGKPILNSVNGEEEKLASILPLAKKYGASVVALTIDEEGIPKTWEKRVEIALKIVERAKEFGIGKEDILIDCLTLTVSAQQKDCEETLKALEVLHKEHGLQQVLGVSNISFGLPHRTLINQSFLTLAMSKGLRLPIMNPNIPEMMDSVFAYRVLSGYDVDSLAYMDRFAGVTSVTSGTGAKSGTSDNNPQGSLEESIIKGLAEQSEEQVGKLLLERDPMDIVNGVLIPTLDLVGKKFEAGEFFLPQLLRSATASMAAFELIKKELSKGNVGTISKGKIILATVKGDVHDIGKNIVKVILENYGYQIIDLGKDVSGELVVSTAKAENVTLIGLSALMTTTVTSMKETIALLRESGHPCQVMVGGAVLTEEYAMKIGADYYAKDAKASADIAKEVL